MPSRRASAASFDCQPLTVNLRNLRRRGNVANPPLRATAGRCTLACNGVRPPTTCTRLIEQVQQPAFLLIEKLSPPLPNDDGKRQTPLDPAGSSFSFRTDTTSESLIALLAEVLVSSHHDTLK